KVLRRLNDLAEIAQRRGVRFTDLLAARSQDPEAEGRLPTHRLLWPGGEAFAWSERQAHELIESRSLRLAAVAAAPVASHGDTPPVAQLRELHENRELEKVVGELEEIGLSIDDYALVQEEAVTGEKLPARFAWVTSAAAPAKREEPAE